MSRAEAAEVLEEAARFEQFLDSVERRLDDAVLEGSPTEREARREAEAAARALERCRQRARELEMEILTTKEQTRVARNSAALARERVKSAQTELSCLTLQLHEFERRREYALSHPEEGTQEAGQEHEEALMELYQLKQQNSTYVPLMREHNEQTARLEQLIESQVRESEDFVELLRERCIRLGQMLHRRMATEDEWAELQLVTREQEEEIGRLKAELTALGGAVPPSPRRARARRAEARQEARAAARRLTARVSVPVGTLRPLITTQGHGLQALRAQHDVAIEVETAPGWSNTLVISGADHNVRAAKAAVSELCNQAAGRSRGGGLVTYPRRESSRVTPIPSPWAKQHRMREELEVRKM